MTYIIIIFKECPWSHHRHQSPPPPAGQKLYVHADSRVNRGRRRCSRRDGRARETTGTGRVRWLLMQSPPLKYYSAAFSHTPAHKKTHTHNPRRVCVWCSHGGGTPPQPRHPSSVRCTHAHAHTPPCPWRNQFCPRFDSGVGGGGCDWEGGVTAPNSK